MQKQAEIGSQDNEEVVDMKKRMQQMINDEDSISEDELQKQLEEFDFYKTKRELDKYGEDAIYARYTNLKDIQDKEQKKLDEMVIDITDEYEQTKMVRTTATNSKKSNTSSKVESSKSTNLGGFGAGTKFSMLQKVGASMIDRKKVLIE